jgi:hypothetical protein
MRVISMFTVNTPYEKVKDNLIKSCERFKLDHKVYPVKNKGDWLLNCKQNTNVILTALDEFKDDLLYVDCDAEFRQVPKLFNKIECDIAYHVIRYPKKEQLCSGTLYLKNCQKVRELVMSWKELNSRNKKWDDDNLQELIKKYNGVLNKYELPQEYCSIRVNRIQTEHDPVIRHTQVSRQLKRVING